MNAIDDKYQGRRLIAPPAGKEKRVDIGYDTFIYSVYNALGVGPKNAVTRRELCARPVSYTHLDVYKRQVSDCGNCKVAKPYQLLNGELDRMRAMNFLL